MIKKQLLTLLMFTLLGTTTTAYAITVEELAAQFEAYKKQQEVELEKIREKNDDLKAENFKLKTQLEETREIVDNNVAAVETVSETFEADEGKSRWYDRTSIGGYGELHYNNWNFNDGSSKNEVDFHRFVLFIGHEFTDKLRFFSEIELEHAVTGDGYDGEVELEQAYIEYDFTDWASAKGGLFLMPVGILNETHEPNTFYGVERNLVETFIIPTTWWEGGLAGNMRFDNGIGLDAGVTTGLEVDNSVYIRGGRGKLSKQTAEDGALFGRVKYTGLPGLELAASLIWEANLSQNVPGVDVGGGFLTEFHAIYNHEIGPGTFQGRALYSRWDIDTNIQGADSQYGWYVEPAYKIPTSIGDVGVYGRYSKLDYYRSKELKRAIYEGGVNWWLHENVVFKADYFYQDGQENFSHGHGFDLGLGYQF